MYLLLMEWMSYEVLGLQFIAGLHMLTNVNGKSTIEPLACILRILLS